MKTIGLIGGMSWESSAEYYRIINEEIKKKLGGYIRQSVFCTVLILKRLNTFNQKELGIKLVKPWGSSKIIRKSRSRFYCNMHKHYAQSN